MSNFLTLVSNFRYWAVILFGIIFTYAFAAPIKVVLSAWQGIETDSLSHGFLVAACIAYLFYLKKDEIRDYAISPSYTALLPLFLLSLIWLIASLSGIQLIQIATLPFILLFATALYFGYGFLRLTITPLVIIFFIIPIWEPLNPILQSVTTSVTHFNLLLINKPVFVEGNFLSLPGGSFHVDTGCSGMRFFLVSGTLSLIYCSLNNLDLKKTFILATLSLSLALISNWIRVLTVVLIGDYTKMQSSIVEDHFTLGWIIFVFFTLIPFFYISKFVSNDSLDSFSSESPSFSNSLNKKHHLAALLACISILPGPILFQFYLQYTPPTSNEIAPPQGIKPWEALSLTASPADWQPSFKGQSSVIYAHYINGQSDSVNLHISHYKVQQEGKELINIENQLTDGEKWIEVTGSQKEVSLDLENGLTKTVNSVEIATTQQPRKKIWYWYNIGGKQTNSPYRAKILQIKTLLEQRRDGSLLVIEANCEFNCEQAEKSLENFFQTMNQALLNSINKPFSRP